MDRLAYRQAVTNMLLSSRQVLVTVHRVVLDSTAVAASGGVTLVLRSGRPGPRGYGGGMDGAMR